MKAHDNWAEETWVRSWFPAGETQAEVLRAIADYLDEDEERYLLCLNDDGETVAAIFTKAKPVVVE